MATLPPAFKNSLAARDTKRIYLTIVDQVVNDVQQHFLSEGVSEQVLTQLKQLWLENLSRQNSFVDDINSGFGSQSFEEELLDLGQTDGVDESVEHDEASSSVEACPAIISQVDGGDDDDDKEKSDVSDDSDDEEDETTNLLLCQHDKVSKAKSLWKPQFKAAVLHLNGKDLVFSKLTGEFKW